MNMYYIQIKYKYIFKTDINILKDTNKNNIQKYRKIYNSRKQRTDQILIVIRVKFLNTC